MKLSDMKQCHLNFRKYEKIRKLCPDGIVVDGLNLLEIIEKQYQLLHDFRNIGNLNPKDTSVRDSELWKMIRECFE